MDTGGAAVAEAAMAVSDFFDQKRIGADDLRAIVSQNRALLAEAIGERRDELVRLPAGQRRQMLAWGQDQYIRVIQIVAKRHPEHAKILFDAYWTYLVPQMDAAKAVVRGMG